MHPFQTALENLKHEYDFEIRSYSGCGMYGKNCLAIIGNNINIFHIAYKVGIELSSSQYDDNYPSDDDFKFRTDNMGLGMVYYWPNVPYTDTKLKDDQDVYEEEG